MLVHMSQVGFCSSPARGGPSAGLIIDGKCVSTTCSSGYCAHRGAWTTALKKKGCCNGDINLDFDEELQEDLQEDVQEQVQGENGEPTNQSYLSRLGHMSEEAFEEVPPRAFYYAFGTVCMHTPLMSSCRIFALLQYIAGALNKEKDGLKRHSISKSPIPDQRMQRAADSQRPQSAIPHDETSEGLRILRDSPDCTNPVSRPSFLFTSSGIELVQVSVQFKLQVVKVACWPTGPCPS